MNSAFSIGHFWLNDYIDFSAEFSKSEDLIFFSLNGQTFLIWLLFP